MIINSTSLGGGDTGGCILIGSASHGDKVFLVKPTSTEPQYKQFRATATAGSTVDYTGIITSVKGTDTYGNNIVEVETSLVESDKGFPVNNQQYGFAVEVVKGEQ